MQQFESLRHRASANGRWFRLGLISTTMAAPLIARWNELRSARQLAELRQQADAGLGTVRRLVVTIRPADGMRRAVSGAPVPREQPLRRSDISTRLWLMGVGVGLVAAGATAYVIARRRLAASATEPLLALPRDGNAAPAGGPGQAQSSTAASNGAATHATAGLSVPVADEESAAVEVEVPPTRPELAHYVGNMHTMIYHDATDEEHLPAEENRVYFASQDEARAAGFRRDRQEVPPTPEAGLMTEGPSL